MGQLKSRFGFLLLTLLLLAPACGDDSPPPGRERGACRAQQMCDSGLVCRSNYCVRPSSSEAGSASPLVISAANPRPRATTWSVNYWQWLSLSDDTAGTESLVSALKPALLRIGGYNNDANVPQPFGHAELDTAVAYARAIGAEPILQLPLLADVDGQPATADSAAALVTYANVTQDYGIKYFAIGNEPDLYATQGSLTDATAPAIPGYTPKDYCASVRAYVAAIKAVDATAQIVGPDLSYKYVAGGGSNDWLTPILQQCGDQFDIVAIHRYPFAAKAATLASAKQDLGAFRNVMSSVRGILQATGQGAKPLALTEMNVAYDTNPCVLDASPGTVGAALWLADTLGTAIDLGLWTSAVWDISDGDDWALGLIGPPPAHTPRPAYYAYALFADHFGPTLLDVASAPSGISAHASRNEADNATEVIAVNWNAAPATVELQVTDLPTAPAAADFVLPGASISAFEIPDTGLAQGWSYAEAERAAGLGPRALASGSEPAPLSDGGPDSNSDGGAGRIVGSHCGATAPVCPKVAPPSATLFSMPSSGAGTLEFGSGAYLWQSYTYAGAGQTPPQVTLSPDGDGVAVTAAFVAPVSEPWEGLGLFFEGASCIDASANTGIRFDFQGDLGGCSLALGANFTGDQSTEDDPTRGACAGGDSVCYPPMSTVMTSPDAADGGTTTIKVPFSAFHGGSPIAKIDASSIVTVQWQLGPAAGAGACSANFTLANVAFY
jgi:hypothetical protein